MGPFKQQLIAKGGAALTGGLKVPGDKSISHRSVILGALANGTTKVSGFLAGADALATRDIFRNMGVRIDGPDNGELTVHGVGLHGLKAADQPLHCGNAGTAMRLLIGLLAGQRFDSELIGDESLSKRPMRRVADPLTTMGANISTEAGCPPVRVAAAPSLNAIDFVMPVASGQLKSAMILAGLYANGTTRVTEPAPTRDHTERMLQGFGVNVQRDGNQVSIDGGQTLTATSIDVPADVSSAAFFMVAASIAPGSDITLTNVGVNPTRTGVIDILRLMGADISISNERVTGGEPIADIRVKHRPLRGIEIPEALVPLAIDEFPVLFVAAACAHGPTVLTGAEELRVKESDRIAAMADGLAALGVDAQPTKDGMRIAGTASEQDASDAKVFKAGTIDSLGDHRIAMAFAVASLRAIGDITINDVANVATSFPDFSACCQQVGLSVQAVD